MDGPARFHNLHNVYVNTGLATKEQLENSVKFFKDELNRKFPGKGYDKCEILNNLVITKGESAKYAYLWVEKPEVYYIICGFNPDGSQRFESFIEPEAPKTEEDDDDFLDDLTSLDITNIVKEKENKKGIKILKPLGPILELPGYEYTPEQAEIAHKEAIAQEENLASNEHRTPNEIPIPKIGYFQCSRSDTTSINDGMCHNILWGKVPDWADKALLYSIFSRYAESLDPKHFSIEFGNHCKDIEKFREVKIDFGSSRKGVGTFALQMTRKTTLINSKTGEKVECMFNYYRPKDKGAPPPTHYKSDKRYDNKGGVPYKKKYNEFLNRNNESILFSRKTG
jgi:hypothetical protein